MIAIDAFLPAVRAEVMACPNPIMRIAVARAAREFCERTHIWKETLDPQPLTAGLTEYEVEPPFTGTRVLALLSIQSQGRLLSPKTEQELNARYGNWRALAGAPWCFVQESPTTFRLVPAPDKDTDEGLTDIRAAITPTVDATEVGDILYDDYVDAISYGALERLLRTPGQAWSNGELSMHYRQLFQREQSQARVRARQGYGVAMTTVRPRRLAGAP